MSDLSDESINTALETLERSIATAAGTPAVKTDPSALANLARAAHNCAKARDRLSHSQGRGFMQYVEAFRELNGMLKPVIVMYIEQMKKSFERLDEKPVDKNVS